MPGSPSQTNNTESTTSNSEITPVIPEARNDIITRRMRGDSFIPGQTPITPSHTQLTSSSSVDTATRGGSPTRGNFFVPRNLPRASDNLSGVSSDLSLEIPLERNVSQINPLYDVRSPRGVRRDLVINTPVFSNGSQIEVVQQNHVNIPPSRFSSRTSSHRSLYTNGTAPNTSRSNSTESNSRG